jgi:ribosome-binding protein aMBF1 (putative translation factor)
MARMSVEDRKSRDAAFAALLLACNPELGLRQTMVAARKRAGLSQREMARRMGTSSSVIARLEVGARSPNVRTLRRMAKATGSRLVVRLEFDAPEMPGG